jgi:hypothetical protein
MTNKMISISPSSTFHTYIARFHLHLHMVFFIQYARACSTYDQVLIHDKQVDVTGVSSVSFTGSFQQILRSL